MWVPGMDGRTLGTWRGVGEGLKSGQMSAEVCFWGPGDTDLLVDTEHALDPELEPQLRINQRL